MAILTSNTKLDKSASVNVASLGIQLYPSIEICGGYATPGCMACCLEQSGHAKIFKQVSIARKERTDLFTRKPALFCGIFEEELEAFKRITAKKLIPTQIAIRLNVFSGVAWEALPEMMAIIRKNPDVIFYDYTANPHLYSQYLAGELPANRKLIFSRKENNEDMCKSFLMQGGKVAAVFEKLPKEHWGYPVVNGDAHDLFYLFPAFTIVGLKPKGRAIKDTTGFVIREEEAKI